VTTRTGSRVYRGAPRDAVPADACHACGKTTKITPTGRRRMHRTPGGDDCTGSGVMVERAAPSRQVDPADVAAAYARVDAYVTRPAAKWRGTP
jgi:hypothetical protein